MSNNNNEEPKVRTPEYIRLGVKPLGSGGKSLLHNSGGIPKVAPQPAKRRIPPPPEPIVHRKITVQAGMPDTPIQMGIRSRGGVPVQTRVNVGMHDEQKWTEGLRTATEQLPNRRVVINPDGTKSVVIDNDEYVDVESLQGIDPLEDTDRPPPGMEDESQEEHYEPEPDPEPEEVQESATLEPGEYAVFYAGECVYRTGDLDKLKSGLENMMVKYKVNLDDVRIYRCIPIKFGIILE